jgi:hypothetical protein
MGLSWRREYAWVMDENRTTTLNSNETVPSEFYEMMRDRAIRWAETNIARLQDMGAARQSAVNRILTEVTQHWGPECESEVEQALGIKFEIPSHCN